MAVVNPSGMSLQLEVVKTPKKNQLPPPYVVTSVFGPVGGDCCAAFATGVATFVVMCCRVKDVSWG